VNDGKNLRVLSALLPACLPDPCGGDTDRLNRCVKTTVSGAEDGGYTCECNNTGGWYRATHATRGYDVCEFCGENKMYDPTTGACADIGCSFEKACLGIKSGAKG
jgi:hypothetical protein